MKKFLGYCLAISGDNDNWLYVSMWGSCKSYLSDPVLFPSKAAANGAIWFHLNTQPLFCNETCVPVPVIQDENGERIALHDTDVKFCICDKEGDYAKVSDDYYNYSAFTFSKKFTHAIILDDISECRVILNLESWEEYDLHALPVINGEPQLDFEPIEIK